MKCVSTIKRERTGDKTPPRRINMNKEKKYDALMNAQVNAGSELKQHERGGGTLG